jgi:hypothetical protein
MPGFPFPGRPGGEHDEPLLDMIIARRVLPPDVPQPMHDLARMLAALAGPAEPGELAQEAAVRAAFSRAAGVSPAARRPGRRRRSWRARRSQGAWRPWGPSRSRARLATAMVAAVAGLGGVLAAYTGVLPSPIQQLAHVTVAAPAPPGPARHRPPVRVRHGAPGTSRPAVPLAPRHPAAPAPQSGHSPFPSFPPAPAAPGGYRPARAICSPDPGYTMDPAARPTAHPSAAPSRPRPGDCASASAKITLPTASRF